MNQPEDDRIDEQLRAAFAPPEASRFEAMAREVTTAVAPAPRRLWPWLLGLAAAMLVGVLLADALSRPDRPDRYEGAELGRIWTAAYEHAVENGFGGGSCCQAPTDLAARCREVCGQALSFAGAGDVELLGCYCGLPTGGCLGLLMQVQGEPVSVFVLPRDRDPRPVLDERDRLRLRRRELGDLVLYAVGPREADEALAGFSL